MPWKYKFYVRMPLLVAMLAIPALAQFEVDPDHFDSPDQIVERSSGHSRKATSRRQDEVRKQIASQQARLESDRKQIEVKAALVEEARQILISAGSHDGAGESVFYIRQKELEALQQSLAAPIREAEAVLAALEGERDALVAPATQVTPSAIRRSRRSSRKVLASSR